MQNVDLWLKQCMCDSKCNNHDSACVHVQTTLSLKVYKPIEIIEKGYFLKNNWTFFL